jgi:hypothetical protein
MWSNTNSLYINPTNSSFVVLPRLQFSDPGNRICHVPHKAGSSTTTVSDMTLAVFGIWRATLDILTRLSCIATSALQSRKNQTTSVATSPIPPCHTHPCRVAPNTTLTIVPHMGSDWQIKLAPRSRQQPNRSPPPQPSSDTHHGRTQTSAGSG